LFSVIACGSDDEDNGDSSPASVNINRNDNSKEKALARLEFPHVKGGNSRVLIYTTNDSYGINYSVEWDCDKKSQRWTAYQMTKSFQGGAGYSGEFMEDPDLSAIYRVDDSSSYYRGSGFSRGHICPSADRQYSKLANAQTFYYTNMQPQYYNFNAGNNYTSPWVRLENQVRVWTKDKATDTLYVVKGGTIEDHQLLTKIRNELRVPKYFFVALLMKNSMGYKAVGFWLEHDNSTHTGRESLGSYAVNIRQLEGLTGIDFFCNLPDDVEEHVETLPVENVKRAWGL
jgi:endonuclease G